MNFRVIKNFADINQDTWIRFVQNHPHGNIFQTPQLYQFYASCKNYEPVVIAVINEFSMICGIILAAIQRESTNFTGYFTSRTIIWGGPLVTAENPENKQVVIDLLLNALVNKVKTKSIYIQFRNLFDLDTYKDTFKQNGFQYFVHLNIQVDTSDNDTIKKNMSSSKLRQIKKSLASGAEIIEPAEVEQIGMFYKILKDLYKQKVRRPLPDYSFFEHFYYMSIDKNLGKYFLIKYRQEIVGGIMCPITTGKVIYEWYVAGLDGKYEGVYPSVLATWAAIEYATKNGLQYFDFMGAGTPDTDYGVREFKSRFGGKEVNFGRFERIIHRLLYKFGKLGISIMKKF